MSEVTYTNGVNGVHHEADEAIDSLYAWIAPPAPASAPLPAAPASVNVRLTISGREVQWTLRDTDEARLAMRLEALLARVVSANLLHGFGQFNLRKPRRRER